MSVPRGKRAESEMEFIHTARELQIHTIRKCVRFPKRYTFYIGQQIAGSATRIYQCVMMANSIYPTNAHEAQIRRDYLLEAGAELRSLVSQTEVAAELFGIEERPMRFWMDLMDKEIRLIKAVLKKDKERYKNLP